MKKIVSLIILVFIFSCSLQDNMDEKMIDSQLDKELSNIMESYSKAISNNDLKELELFKIKVKEFDKKYNSNISEEFFKEENSIPDRLNSSSGSSDNPPILDLPIVRDGDIYLSWTNEGAFSTIVSYINPTSTEGRYYHGACLDLEKFDPTNLDSLCFQTAISKGAGYETPNIWMRKGNVCILKPINPPNKKMLDDSQKMMDYFCDPKNTNMKYGFFQNQANIFSAVTKEDNYYWYCTKMVWRIYNNIGIDIDSNSPKIDWTKSGLYSFVKAYYNSIYFYNSKKAKEKLEQYIENIRKTIVIADEIYYSPYFTKVYENIRYY